MAVHPVLVKLKVGWLRARKTTVVDEWDNQQGGVQMGP